jgi:hypothetical protein
MSSDEAEQDVEFLVEFDNGVVLLEVDGRCRVSLDLLLLLFGSDRHGSLERESGEVLDGLSLGGGEEKGLTGFGEMGEDSVEGSGETHVEDSVGFVEN